MKHIIFILFARHFLLIGHIMNGLQFKLDFGM